MSEDLNQIETTQATKAKVVSKSAKIHGNLLKRFFLNRMTVLIMGVVIGFFVGYFAPISHRDDAAKLSGIAAQQAEQQKLMTQYVSSVSKLMILPKGEEPVMATITDAKSLAKDQVFYTNAQNGDVVLVYQKAMQAIIYSPTRNVIVNVGPVYYQNQATATSTSAVASSTPKKK